MTDTLFSLTLAVARELRAVIEGVATGGSTTTLIDTVDRKEDNDFWNLGTVWIIYDAGGAGAAPENEYSMVTDFDGLTTYTLTLRSTLTAAPAAGDIYGVATNEFPLYQIISAINQALLDFGWVEKIDVTTITIAAAVTEYSLPVDCRQLLKVEIPTTSDSDDNRFIEVPRGVGGWMVQKNNTYGSADTLILPFQYTTGYKLKLTYLAPHAKLTTSTSKLHDWVKPEHIVYRAALNTLLWKRAISGSKKYDDDISLAMLKVNELKMLSSVVQPPPRRQGQRMMIDQESTNYPGDVNNLR